MDQISRSPMDKSVEPAVEVESPPPAPPEAKRPRRCVQSKLFWHAPPPPPEGASKEGEVEEEEGRQKRRRKSQPQKSSVTSNEVLTLKADSSISPKSSKKSLCEKHKKEQQDAVPLKAGISKCSEALDSKASSKNCRQLNKQKSEATAKKATPKKVTPKKATPKKIAKSSHPDAREPKSLERLTNKFDAKKNLDDEYLHTSPPVLNLRLEAKMAAEENVRLSAGKQIHPFFTCLKAANRADVQDLAKEERRWSVPDGDCLDSCSIHVFDTLGDDVVSLDWKNWEFVEETSHDLNDGYHALGNTLSVFEGSIEPLKLDTISCEAMHMDKLSNGVKGNCSNSAAALHIFPNGKDAKENIVSPSQVHVSTGDSFSFRCASVIGNMENEHPNKLLKGRLSSYYQRCSYSPQCSLWTNKYQPENALEVCGNKESIRSLSEWLKSWHEKGLESCKSLKYDEKNAIGDGEDSSYEGESDMDEIDDDATLKNVLLITGPIGCGKSAAIYACAKEQGFEVIEVNASDARNGSHVRQKYGEAMESHGFNRWSCENPIDPRRKNILELMSSPPDMEGKQIEFDSLQMISRTCNQDTAPAERSLDVMENRTISSHVANKTLILFEDVDTVFNEDRGFISTILQLAETAKRPIILTSNNKNPVLPQGLDRLVLDFTLPSSDELLPHLYMICASEKALVSSHLLEQLIRFCLGDIRKTLMLLQFWCQGNRDTERNMQFTYSPLPCDVDAAHFVMPRVIPWEFKYELSEKVDEEISKTISAVEENLRLREALKQQQPNSTELIHLSNTENDASNPVKSRKKRRLKRNHSVVDQSEVSAHACDLEDFSDALGSPVICARRTVKHRPGTVLSSQSDDQSDGDNPPPADSVPCVSTVPITQVQEIPNGSEVSIDPMYQFGRDDTVQSIFLNFETASASHICDTFKLQDMSCVPESSFVSVSETKDEVFLSTAVSSYNMSATFVDFIEPINVPPRAEVDISNRAVAESSKCTVKDMSIASELDVESVHGNEEQGEFQNEDGEPLASVYQLLDECSQAAFSIVPGKTDACPSEVEPVQVKWRQLRSCCEDYKPYLTSDEKDASSIVKLASRLTDLISETDIMFGACTPLVNDVLEPSRTPSVEPDGFSWYGEQLEMGSTYSQHGLCYYTNNCSIIGSKLGCENTLNLAQEMLASSNNSTALGKLLTHENNLYQDSQIDENLHKEEPGYSSSSGRELESDFYKAVLPVVPARLSLSLRGPAFHDYLSFMRQISKAECARLSESTNKNHKRRYRGSKHYLSSGSLSLSPEDLDLLARSSLLQ